MNTKKFADEMKNLAKGQEINNELVWLSLEGELGEDNANYFCLQIFLMLIHSQKKQFVYENQERMLATLIVLEYYKNRQGKNVKVLENCRALLENRKNKIYGHGMLSILLFLNKLQEINFIEKLLSRYLYIPEVIEKDIHPADQIQVKIKQGQIYTSQLAAHRHKKYYSCLKSIAFPSNKCVQSKILSFSFVCMNDYFKQKKNVVDKEKYTIILNALKAHIISLGKSKSSQPFLMCSIYLIQKMITFYGCPSPQILKQMMVCLGQLRNYYQEISQFAEETLLMVYSELQSPGSAFRKVLKTDFPFLQLNKKQKKKEYYLITSRDQIFRSNSNCSIHNLRKLMILQIVRTCQFENHESFVRTLKILDENMTFQLYKKIMKLSELLMNLDGYQLIKKQRKQSVIQLFRVTNEELNKNQTKISKKQDKQLQSLLNYQNEIGIFSYPNYQIVYVTISKFLQNKKQFSFNDIVEKNYVPELNFFKNKIPLIFYGDDEEFTTVLNKICPYLEKNPIEKSLSFKFYYIPKTDHTSAIPKYLAEKDIWYKRSIYYPFKYNMIYPIIEFEAANRDLFPLYLYNQLLKIYVRQARKTFPIRIYKCQLTYRDKKQACVYFCGYIYLGTSAEAQILRLHKEQDKDKFKKYSQIDYIELLTTKLKKVQSLNLSFSLKEVHPTSKKIEQKAQKNIKIENLQICNVPVDYFFGNEPQPTGPYLSLSMLTQNYGKIFRKQLMKKDNFQDDKKAIQAFRDLFINASIESITIKNEGKVPFSIIIDGAIHNEIEILKVEAAFNSNDLPLTLPIQTFLQC